MRNGNVGTLRLLALATFAVCAASCVTRQPIQRLTRETPVALVLVVDEERGATRAPPPKLRSEVEAALRQRNLSTVPSIEEGLLAEFSRIRLSGARFGLVRQRSTNAEYAVLGEMRVEYFWQNNGRYRWLVYLTLTAARVAGGEPVTRSFEIPVFLNFPPEREREALIAAAETIAANIGSLIDDLLAMPVDPTLPVSPVAPPAGSKTGAAAPGSNPLSAPQAPYAPLPAPKGDAVYFVMVDRFANGNRQNDGKVDPSDEAAFHGGDIDGLIGKLDYLYGLGIRTVWLSPVFEARTEKFYGHGAFHGYWVEDLGRVDPRFGDEAALRRLSDALHQRGMRLVLDMVLNHVGPDAPLASQRPEWFHRKGPIQDWSNPRELETHDVHGLPDFDTSREDVYAYLRDTSLSWVSRVQLDGLRLDAVKHLPVSFWQRYAEDAKRVGGRNFWLLGEMLDGDARTVSKVQEEGRFDSMFDFPLHFALVDVFCKGRSAARLGAVLSQDRYYDNPRSLVTLLDNHDLPRILSECGGDMRKVSQALAIQLTARGTPSFTYGFEVGLRGDKEPSNRGDMKFERHPLVDEVKERLALRRAHPVLEQGASRILLAEERLFAYLRLSPNEAALIAVNQEKKARKVRLPPELDGLELTDAGTKEKLHGPEVEVPADSVRVVFVKPSRPGALAALTDEAERASRGLDKRRTVEVELEPVRGARKASARSLYIVGSGPELGDWNPEKGVALAGKGRRKLTLPVGSVLEYKLVERQKGAAPKWEEGENRVLFVGDGKAPLKLQLNWRNEQSLTAKGEAR